MKVTTSDKLNHVVKPKIEFVLPSNASKLRKAGRTRLRIFSTRCGFETPMPPQRPFFQKLSLIFDLELEK